MGSIIGAFDAHPRARVAQLLEALDQVGIRLNRAEIAEGPDGGSCLPFEAEDGAKDRNSRQLIRAAALCCAALAIAPLVMPFAARKSC